MTNSRAPKRRFTSGRGWERDLPLKIASTVHRIAQLCASLSLIVCRDGSREHPIVTTLKTKAKNHVLWSSLAWVSLVRPARSAPFGQRYQSNRARKTSSSNLVVRDSYLSTSRDRLLMRSGQSCTYPSVLHDRLSSTQAEGLFHLVLTRNQSELELRGVCVREGTSSGFAASKV